MIATTGRRLSTAKAARNGVYRLETNVSKLKLFRQHVCSKQKIPEKKPFNLAGWHLVFGPKTKVLWNSLFPQPKQTFPKQTFSQKQTNKQTNKLVQKRFVLEGLKLSPTELALSFQFQTNFSVKGLLRATKLIFSQGKRWVLGGKLVFSLFTAFRPKLGQRQNVSFGL